MEYLILILIGYLCGNINPAYIIAKTKKVDIRSVGSKNPGASNVTMTFGWKYGIITGLVDIFKALLPVLIFNILGYNDFQLLVVGYSVILGHMYPVFFKFKGGKGTASFIGVMFGLNPLFGFLTGIVLVIMTIITDFIALGTITMMIGWMIASYFIFDFNSFLLSISFPLVSIYKHLPNVSKILNKEESGLRATFKK